MHCFSISVHDFPPVVKVLIVFKGYIYNFEMKQLDFTKFIRKYLKTKLIKNTDGFKNHETERNQLYSLLSRTIEKGESNSVLIIGRPGSGKTTVNLFNPRKEYL